MKARYLPSVLFVLAMLTGAQSALSQSAPPTAKLATSNWSPTNPPQIYTVSIHNSPGVADKGSHSVLGGILKGDWTAIEPHLGICVQPNGVAAPKVSCTQICQPGHDCKQDFNTPPRLRFPNPSVHVQVWDINDKGEATDKLAEFDVPDATQCTLSGPCSVPRPAGGASIKIGFDFGTIECDDASYAPAASAATSGLALFATPTEGMRPDTGAASTLPNQHNPWREYFCLSQPSQRGGWVVQKIQVESPESPMGLVFWETFVVLPGQRHSAYPDTFFYPFSVHQSGFMSVNATATFYDGLSNDFIRTHYFLNMPGKGVQIQQPSQDALSTTDPAIVNQLNQLASNPSIKVSNTLYRAWHLTVQNGRVVP